jgi:hypothetical protein
MSGALLRRSTKSSLWALGDGYFTAHGFGTAISIRRAFPSEFSGRCIVHTSAM